MKGMDYSWHRPGGAAIAAAGFEFVVRYVPYPGDGGKGLEAPELADLRANGLAVCLVWETTAGRALDGYEAGRFDATMSHTSAARLGFPADRPIYFAVDFDAQPTQYAAIDAYLRGCADVIGIDRVGVYGSFDVVRHCDQFGTARWLWQTYAWSGGRVYPANDLYQYLNGQTLNGGAVDYNDTSRSDYGQWPAEEDNMADPRVDEILKFIGEADMKAWLAKQNVPLIQAFASEQTARGEATNAINAHIDHHPGGAIGDHTHIPGGVAP